VIEEFRIFVTVVAKIRKLFVVALLVILKFRIFMPTGIKIRKLFIVVLLVLAVPVVLGLVVGGLPLRLGLPGRGADEFLRNWRVPPHLFCP
jgi:hypothetical protein